MKAKWPEQLKSRILPTRKHVRRFGEFHTIYIILYLGVWIKFFFHLVIFIVFPNFIINLFLSVRRFFWSQQRDRRPEYPFFEMTFLVGCTAMLARTCTVTGVFHSHGGTPLSLDVFLWKSQSKVDDNSGYPWKHPCLRPWDQGSCHGVLKGWIAMVAMTTWHGK